MSLDSQIAAVLNPTSTGRGGGAGSGGDGNSMIVLNHLAQMKMFGIRQGIEFYPEQDDIRGTRKTFLDEQYEFNQLELYHERIWDLVLCKGEVLIYYRPNSRGGYDISFFPKGDYRAFYNAEGELEEVIIKYFYYEAPGTGVNIMGSALKQEKDRVTTTIEAVAQEIQQAQEKEREKEKKRREKEKAKKEKEKAKGGKSTTSDKGEGENDPQDTISSPDSGVSDGMGNGNGEFEALTGGNHANKVLGMPGTYANGGLIGLGAVPDSPIGRYYGMPNGTVTVGGASLSPAFLQNQGYSRFGGGFGGGVGAFSLPYMGVMGLMSGFGGDRNNGIGGNRVKRWIKLTIGKDYIVKEVYRDGMEPGWGSVATLGNGGIREVYENTIGFIPCRIIKNNPLGRGMEGVGEFEAFRSQIEAHESAAGAMEENLAFFGNPILVATRSPAELTELSTNYSANLNRAHTAMRESGWEDAWEGSTRKSAPRHLGGGGAGGRGGMGGGGMGRQLRVKKVIGNVNSDERFAFIAPPPIVTDHAKYVTQTREAIHFALGGIDETGIHASATAYEMKTVYGKVATTALKKARAIYEYGLCRVFEDLMAIEENLFRKTFSNAMGIPIEQVTDQLVNQLLEQTQGQLPPGVFGLPPIGRRKVKWRWKGPVFEDSPDDMQRKSIVVRNLQELGVRSLDALNVLFPDLTQKEKQGMLAGGFPFRYLNAVAGTTGQMLGLYQQMLQLPAQSDPNVVMASKLPIEPMVERSLQTIFNELNYERPIEPSRVNESPYRTGTTAYREWLQRQSELQSAIGAMEQYLGSGQVSTKRADAINPALLAAGVQSGVTPMGWSGGLSAGSGSGGLSSPVLSIPPDYVAGLPSTGAVVTNPSGLRPNSQPSLQSTGVSATSPSTGNVPTGYPYQPYSPLNPPRDGAGQPLPYGEPDLSDGYAGNPYSPYQQILSRRTQPPTTGS